MHVAEKKFKWIFFWSSDRDENPKRKSSLGDKTQKNTRIFIRPKKICDRSLDPKKYPACKFSAQKNTSDPPVMYTSSTPPGTDLLHLSFLCVQYDIHTGVFSQTVICW